MIENNQSSAPGPDGVDFKLMSTIFQGPRLLQILTVLMNSCMEKARIPTSWAVSEMIVLYKGKGCPSDPDSYRGICLQSCFTKLFERLLLLRLNSWMEDKVDTMLGPDQFGF